MGERRRISSFSVLLLTAAAALAGALCTGGLSLRYTPEPKENRLQVWVSLPDASPSVMEAEVTSRIEAVLTGMSSCKGISSTSSKGSGSVTVDLSKKTDLQEARFEASTRLANLWPSLPQGTSYPYIIVGGGKKGGQMVWRLRSAIPAPAIARFAREQLIYPLSCVKGVDNVEVSGDIPYEWIITFDHDKALSLGLHGSDIAEAVRTSRKNSVVGLWNNGANNITVRLEASGSGSETDFYNIPIRCKGSDAPSIIRLGEIASFSYRETEPSSYFRLNGLNTITLSASVADDANILRTAKTLRSTMESLETEVFPEGMEVDLGYDSSEYVRGELHKIFLRTAICLIILLLFSFLVGRSWRQMVILVLSLFGSLLISIGIYRLLGLSIHIYTLAGITVSFGIMIDTSIMMTDHYGKYRDTGSFPSIVYAVLTTVAALLMILLLPENERLNLGGFIAVIVVNLTVSLLLCRFFVPAMMDILGRDAPRKLSPKAMRRKARMRSFYARYISWGTRHRWIYWTVLLICFGIPTYLIPQKSSLREDDVSLPAKIARMEPYASSRVMIDRIAGSLSGMFYRSLERYNIFREPDRTVLTIRAGMPEGCTVAQLNEVVLGMENFLSQFDGIESFTTSVRSFDDAVIQVRFTKEAEASSFPSILKSGVTAAAINFGGANWTVSGVDDNYFNNNIVSDYKSDRITLRGYNFTDLYGYAEQLVSYLATNSRVSAPEIWAGGWWGRPVDELHISYDRQALAAAGVSPESYYNALSSRLFSTVAGHIISGGVATPVKVRSSRADDFDLWKVQEEPLKVDSTYISLSGIGQIEKKRSEIEIDRYNQSYSLSVCYDFIGSWQLSRRVVEDAVNYMNTKVLPIGYKAEMPEGYLSTLAKKHYLWLILLIIAVLYVMLSIAFESLRHPLAVILMIPVSFIGIFLVFGLSEFQFDQGGFASMIMICGLTVNAGIYLVTDYRSRLGNSVGAWMHAFSRKIIPISLTLISTVLGLLPFLSDGPGEVFWFDFSIGTIAALTMSVVALILYLPVFICPRK